MRFASRNNRRPQPPQKDHKDLLTRSVSVGTTEYTQVFGALRDRLNYFAQFFQFYFAGLLFMYGAAITSKAYEVILPMGPSTTSMRLSACSP